MKKSKFILFFLLISGRLMRLSLSLDAHFHCYAVSVPFSCVLRERCHFFSSPPLFFSYLQISSSMDFPCAPLHPTLEQFPARLCGCGTAFVNENSLNSHKSRGCDFGRGSVPLPCVVQVTGVAVGSALPPRVFSSGARSLPAFATSWGCTPRRSWMPPNGLIWR